MDFQSFVEGVSGSAFTMPQPLFDVPKAAAAQGEAAQGSPSTYIATQEGNVLDTESLLQEAITPGISSPTASTTVSLPPQKEQLATLLERAKLLLKEQFEADNKESLSRLKTLAEEAKQRSAHIVKLEEEISRLQQLRQADGHALETLIEEHGVLQQTLEAKVVALRSKLHALEELAS